jgi:hypothetical protein
MFEIKSRVLHRVVFVIKQCNNKMGGARWMIKGTIIDTTWKGFKASIIISPGIGMLYQIILNG